MYRRGRGSFFGKVPTFGEDLKNNRERVTKFGKELKV